MELHLLAQVVLRLGQLRRHETWTPAQLAAHQATALHRLRAHAYAHSPFYQQFHRGLLDRPLAELPVLTKAQLMEHFDELVTDRAIRLEAVRTFAAARQTDQRFLGRYWVAATSGSSGQPAFFLFNEAEWLTILAASVRGRDWAGASSFWPGRKLATVASVSPWHLSSLLPAAAPAWWLPTLRLPATEALDRIVQQLNAWQPAILLAYASMARLLAEEQLAGRLQIRPGYTFTTSEMLTAETRRRVQQAWGHEPFNQYAATETAVIAAEDAVCRHLHVFEDMLLVEVVDEHNQPVPPGTYGAKLLVTTLYSRTQPLIRYELADQVRLAPTLCSHRPLFAVLESIQGRIEDRLALPAQAGGRITVAPLVFNRIMDILPISGWQIVQGAADDLTVLLSGAGPALNDAALAEALRASLAAEGVQPPPIQVQRVAGLPQAASGKTPLVQAYRA